MFTSLYILMDNRAREGFRSSWGLSMLLDGDVTLLFDAGPSGDDLLHNLALCGYDAADIDIFFLSHSHVDHGGGLLGLQEAGFSGEIMFSDYTPGGSKGGGAVRRGLCPLGQGLTAVRLSSGGLHEQSLLADSPRGPVLLVGCAHPGLENIWSVACEQAKPYAVIGGFHGSMPFQALQEAALLGPCHCTQHREAFRERFPSSFVDFAAGDRLDMGGARSGAGS